MRHPTEELKMVPNCGSFRYLSSVLAAVLVCVMLRVSQAAANAESQPPNIIFLLIDDMGWNDIGYQNSEFSTPNLDSLAAEGIILDNYYVQPSCSPTRSQLMSGRYQIHTGMQHGFIWSAQANGLPLDEVTLADKMKEAGYSTHIIGKWHLGFFEEEYMPQYRGFDSFFGFLTNFIEYYNHTAPYGELPYHDLRDEDGPVWKFFGAYSPNLYSARAKYIIRNHNSSEAPLFIYYSQQLVHFPPEVPDDYYNMTIYSDFGEENRTIYAGMVTFLDDTVGELVRDLKMNGLWENTLLVVSTDNGGSDANSGNNWPLRGCKGSYFEGGIRGVAFLAGPYLVKSLANGVSTGTVNRELMHVTDWYPTLVNLAGGDLDGTKPLDGVDQWSMLTQGTQNNRTEILHNIDELFDLHGERLYSWTFDTRIQASIRVGDYKLLTGDQGESNWTAPPEDPTISTIVPDDPEDKNVWLFNLVDDPLEENDLSDSHPDKVIELLERLSIYQAGAVEAYWPRINNADADPALHGNVWGPWYEENEEDEDVRLRSLNGGVDTWYYFEDE